MKKGEKIISKGQIYASPRAESIEITCQGVWCASLPSTNAKIEAFEDGGYLL